MSVLLRQDARNGVSAPEFPLVAPHTEVHPTTLTLMGLGLFVFSLIFEDAKIGGVEPSTLAGLFFLFTAVLQPGIFFRRPKASFVLVGLFVFVCVLTALLSPLNYPAETARRSLQFAYLLVMGLMLASAVRSPKAMDVAISSVAAAGVSLAALQVTGIGARKWDAGIGERITAFGFHPNQLAFNLCLGVVALMSLTMRPKGLGRMPVALALPLIGIIALALVQTGSRGGLISLAFGIGAFCFQPGRPAQRFKALGIAAVGVVLVGGMVLSSESTMKRIEATLVSGNVARRDKVYPIAYELFGERPVYGWGAGENTYQLGNRFQEREMPSKDTHNAILYVLTASGIVGSVPFFLAVLLALRSAWRARRTSLGVAPMALMFCVLAAAMGVTLIQAKIFWLVLAIAAVADEGLVGGDL